MTSVSTFGAAQSQLNHLKDVIQQTQTLETQATTGKKSQTLSGLGSDALTDLQSNASLASLTAYDSNITIGQTHLQLMSNAVSQIRTQTNAMVSAMSEVTQDGNTDTTALNSLAKNSLSFITNLLNQKQGSTYLFSGADSSTAPLSDSDTLNTYTQTQVSDWASGKITTDQLIASFTDPTQLTDTTVGYSANLSSGQARNVAIKADDNAEVDYTTLANDPSFRNILAATQTLINLTSTVDNVQSTYTTDDNGVTTKSDPAGTTSAPGTTATEQGNNFYAVFNSILGTLSNASTGLDQVSSKIGYAQATLKTIQANHTTDETTLQSTVSSVENVDINDVAVKLTSLQTQLQAAYQVTASMQKYSLVNYL